MQDSKVYKEVFIALSYLDDELLKKIPDHVLRTISEFSANCDDEVYLDKTKSLTEQNLSEESKSLLSLIYYTYLSDDKEKKHLTDIWNKNENKG